MQLTLAWKIDMPFEASHTEALHSSLCATAGDSGGMFPSYIYPSYTAA
jgi:hypothetical protein